MIGNVEEVFGPVRSPYYTVRFNDEKDVSPDIVEGAAVCYVVGRYKFATNIHIPGSDASNMFDEEIPLEEQVGKVEGGLGIVHGAYSFCILFLLRPN